MNNISSLSRKLYFKQLFTNKVIVNKKGQWSNLDTNQYSILPDTIIPTQDCSYTFFKVILEQYLTKLSQISNNHFLLLSGDKANINFHIIEMIYH